MSQISADGSAAPAEYKRLIFKKIRKGQGNARYQVAVDKSKNTQHKWCKSRIETALARRTTSLCHGNTPLTKHDVCTPL